MKQEEFFDEQIIDMINQAQQKTTASASNASKNVKQVEKEVQAEAEKSIFDTGVKILGKWISFERRLLAKETITMMLPKDFVPMPPEIARMKYPSEHRPETILTEETGSVNLMLQYMEGEVDNTTIEIFRNQVFGMMKRVNSGIKEREMGAVDVAGVRIAYVEFSNNAMDGKLYNLMFYLSVKGKPLMGSFNCMTKDMKYWKTIAFEMMQSIELIEA
ncbi:MAG: hypothetical protein IJN16_09865 [Lachnospiraceae bacterium]|nr:hypothetical protein [Lachnospiraceae bacterium]